MSTREGNVNLTGMWLILLIIDPSQSGAEWKAAFVRVASESLGLEVEVVESVASGDALDSAEDAIRIEVRWDALQQTAVVDVRAPGMHNARSVQFEPEDPAEQRGRTLAFVAASMLPEANVRPQTATAGPTPSPERPSASNTQEAPPSTVSVEALGAFGIGVSDDDGHTAFGGEGAFRWHASDRISLRLSASARTGTLAAAKATTSLLGARAGIAYLIISAASSPHLALAARADFGVSHLNISHFSADDPEAIAEGTWMAAADALAELAWQPRRNIGLVLALGIEVVSSRTRVFVSESQQAQVGYAHLLATFGVRASF